MLRLRLFALVLALVVPTLAGCDPPAEDLLPDVGMARLADIRLVWTADGRSLLRFSTTIVNVGKGPFELHGKRPTADTPTMAVVQRIDDDQGGHRDRATVATMYFSGDGHNHWHVRDLESYRLARRDNGVRVGVGAKHGFCFYDNVAYRLSLPRAPAARVYTNCGMASDLTVAMGLSVGWGDKYRWDLPDQYIDITGLALGHYRLTAKADESGWFRESNEGNNATWVDLRLGSNGVVIEGYGPYA